MSDCQTRMHDATVSRLTAEMRARHGRINTASLEAAVRGCKAPRVPAAFTTIMEAHIQRYRDAGVLLASACADMARRMTDLGA